MKPNIKRKKSFLPQSVFYLIHIFFFSLLYFATALLGLGLDAVSGFATLFWLPTGISLAAVLLFGYRVFPGIFLGAFFANFLNGAPLPASTGIALGNTAEALVGAYFLRLIGFHPSLERLKDVLGLVMLAAFASTTISATVGVASLLFSGILSASFLTTWVAWWIGDLLSNLIAAPFLLVWSQKPTVTYDKRKLLELAAFGILVVLIGLFIFQGLFGVEITRTPFTYFVFPPVIWAAIRFGQREVVTAIFILFLLAILGTAQGHGPFVRATLSESLLLLQSFMVVVSVTSMILAAAISERRALEKRKDDFISFASHELKTPITSIKAYNQLLQKTLAKKRNKELLKHVRRMDGQINKLTSLISTMLDVSKMQRASLELQMENFSLNALLDDIINATQASTGYQIVKRGRVSDDIIGDKERIGQVIGNMLSNAIKYSPRKKRIVLITK